jgi:hypothetical protein
MLQFVTCVQGWPEPYIYTVCDRMFGDFPAQNTVYIYGFGQPYIYVCYIVCHICACIT